MPLSPRGKHLKVHHMFKYPKVGNLRATSQDSICFTFTFQKHEQREQGESVRVRGAASAAGGGGKGAGGNWGGCQSRHKPGGERGSRDGLG